MCLPSAPKQAAPPPLPDIPQAPTEVSPGVLAAKKRARTQAASQAGFASTIVTGGRGVTEFAGTADPSLIGSRAESQPGVKRTTTTTKTTAKPATPATPPTPAGNNLGGIPEDMLAELRRRFGKIGSPSVGVGGASNVTGSARGTFTTGGGSSLVSSGGGGGGRRGRRF